MKRFIYRHAFLCELLAFLPVAFLCAYLIQIHMAFYLLLVIWGVIVLSYVQRRIPSELHREAVRKLDELCDPEAFLTDIRFLMSRRGIGARRRFFLGMEAACGLDSLGRSAESLAEMQRLEAQADRLFPMEKIVFHVNYATVMLHVERTRAELPRAIAALESEIAAAQLPPPLTEDFRKQVETLRDGYRFENGDYGGLRERYVAEAENARKRGASRRMVVHCCMRLARLYDKLDHFREAAALYEYVEKNGNRLGAVETARAARAELLIREKEKKDTPVCCENTETAPETADVQ